MYMKRAEGSSLRTRSMQTALLVYGLPQIVTLQLGKSDSFVDLFWFSCTYCPSMCRGSVDAILFNIVAIFLVVSIPAEIDTHLKKL